MKVDKLNNNTTFTSGVYFSKASNICFDKTAEFLNPRGIVKASENGYKYIEDANISKLIKDKFLKNRFIKKISQKFDTFVWFKQLKPDAERGSGHIAITKLWWADPSKEAAELMNIIGVSKNSAREALNNMFKELK